MDCINGVCACAHVFVCLCVCCVGERAHTHTHVCVCVCGERVHIHTRVCVCVRACCAYSSSVHICTTGQTDSKPVRIDISQLHISDPNTVCTGFSVKSIDIQGPVIEPSASYPGPYTCGPTDQGPSPQPPLQQPLLPPPPQPPLSQPSQSGQQGGEDVTPMETAGPSEQGSSPPPSTPPQSGQQGGDGGSDGQGPNDQKPSPPPPQPPPQPTESEQQSKEGVFRTWCISEVLSFNSWRPIPHHATHHVGLRWDMCIACSALFRHILNDERVLLSTLRWQ